MELFKAHRQWASRPNDERFPTIQALHDAAKHYAECAREKTVEFGDLRTEAINGEVQLVGKIGVPAQLTHWAFGQLAARVGAPASYLRDLPATLACQNLNHGLANRAKDEASSRMAKLMFHQNGSLLLRALTGGKYERIWNWEVAERLLSLEAQGWEPATPDFNTMGNDKQTALYVSDHDMFAFLRTNNVTVAEPGTDQPIYRGIIVENSEVGAAALKVTRFLYRCMCGNHIIWGASKVFELSVRHVGEARRKWNTFATQIKQWSDESASEEEGMIAATQHKMIADTKEAVLDAIFGKRAVGLSRKTLEAGYDANIADQDGDPRTVWGFVQGLTRHSQTVPHADTRTVIDRAAGKLLEANF